MAAKKTINWSLNAMLMLGELFEYLEDQMGNLAASDYLDKLMDFGNSLESKSSLHPFCRHQKLQLKSYRCARFRNKYLIVFKENQSQVEILAVLHVKRGPQAFDDLVE